jgi:lysophospholipase L1-like esterase
MTSTRTLTITRDTRLLFIGDSITDCGRREDKDALGTGYVRRVRDYLAANDPATAPVVINTGISGNKIPDLQKRWDRDVLEHRPDIVSIKIGINDVWHGLHPDRQGCPIEPFTAGYRKILTKLKQSRPACAIVLCEPSVIRPPAPAEGNERLQPYLRAVHDLAEEFGAACVVPLHGAFESAYTTRPDIAWTTDGVHPTSAGHMLIALSWLRATGML